MQSIYATHGADRPCRAPARRRAGRLTGVLHAIRAGRDPSPGDPWLQAQAIIDRLALPLPFRDEDFLDHRLWRQALRVGTKVRAHVSFQDEELRDIAGAQRTDCYAAFAKAIAAYATRPQGGGRVVIPAGNWYCAGPIVLLSNVHVHLKSGAHAYFEQPAGRLRRSTGTSPAAPTAIWCARAGRATIA